MHNTGRCRNADISLEKHGNISNWQTPKQQKHVSLTLDIIGIFLTNPVALDESVHASTIASSSGSVMNAIANESDFAVSSLEVAILRTSMGFEFRVDIWYK